MRMHIECFSPSLHHTAPMWASEAQGKGSESLIIKTQGMQTLILLLYLEFE